MLILAVDTTSEVGGVGIFRDAESVALVPNRESADRYSVTLFEMVQDALRQAHFEFGDIDLYAAANGPGSFTGIRVGLAATRAWAKAFERPVRGVSVLQAMVENLALGTAKSRPLARAGQESGDADSRGTSGMENVPDWCFPILDARRGDFFVGSFRLASGRAEAEIADAQFLSDRRDSAVVSSPAMVEPQYEPAEEGWLLKRDALRTLLQERADGGLSVGCLTRAHDHAAIDFCAELPGTINKPQVEGILLDAIAAIARGEQQRGKPSTGLDAYYIRRPDAEIKFD